MWSWTLGFHCSTCRERDRERDTCRKDLPFCIIGALQSVLEKITDAKVHFFYKFYECWDNALQKLWMRLWCEVLFLTAQIKCQNTHCFVIGCIISPDIYCSHPCGYIFAFWRVSSIMSWLQSLTVCSAPPIRIMTVVLYTDSVFCTIFMFFFS